MKIILQLLLFGDEKRLDDIFLEMITHLFSEIPVFRRYFREFEFELGSLFSSSIRNTNSNLEGLY